MRFRPSPLAAALLSLAALGGLGVVLLWPAGGPKPLVALCAASTRPPMEATAADYERATGTRVELRFGGSEDLLTKIRLGGAADPADVFVPADESYVRMAEDRGLVGDVVPIAGQKAVVLVAAGNPKGITSWADLTRDGVTMALANPEAAAVGKLTRDHLRTTGKWPELERRLRVSTGTVTEAANAVKLGGVDAAVVWDSVATNYPQQVTVPMPELDGVVAEVQAATLRGSADPAAAAAFARYVAAADGGLPHFRRAGFRVAGSGAAR